jgi:hypothetical protein
VQTRTDDRIGMPRPSIESRPNRLKKKSYVAPAYSYAFLTSLWSPPCGGDSSVRVLPPALQTASATRPLA